MLHWFNEGDGYYHAHTEADCRTDHEDADMLLETHRTVISVTLPAMTPADAQRLAESLYETALLFVKLRAEVKTHG